MLDGNNTESDGETPALGRDGVEGGYFIDTGQRRWLQETLALHRHRPKLVFCHQELHHTPIAGSAEGGDVPFSPEGKENSFVDNGWQVRKLLAADGKVLACFHGHKHANRHAIYGGVHYLTLA